MRKPPLCVPGWLEWGLGVKKGVLVGHGGARGGLKVFSEVDGNAHLAFLRLSRTGVVGWFG